MAEHPPKAAAPTGPADPPPPADLPVPAFISTLQAAFPDVPGGNAAIVALSYFVGDWVVIVAPERILEVSRYLAATPETRFDFLPDLTATDWPPRAERFDLIYCLYSTVHRHRLRMKARLADGQSIASVTSVWPAANWFEREAFDMFGIT